MSTASPVVQDISDTARWAAVFRARESLRLDALFRDPYAFDLAGARGFEIADTLSNESHSTSWVVRTYLFDQMIEREILGGVDTVVNLGAGLDARPYRMDLPASLRWIEIDGPEILEYKEQILAGEKPHCKIERLSLNLLDRDKRNVLFSRINRSGEKILILCEGVLIYLPRGEVATLAGDLAEQNHFKSWILEVVSPAVLDTMNSTAGAHVSEAGVSFQFGPAEGPSFFAKYGWQLSGVQSVLNTAISLNRTPIKAEFRNLLPDLPPSGQNSLPWVGVCLFNSQRGLPSRLSGSPPRGSFESRGDQIRNPPSSANS